MALSAFRNWVTVVRCGALSQALTVKEKRRAAKAYRKRNESRLAIGGPEQAPRRSSRILKKVCIHGLHSETLSAAKCDT